MGSKKNRHGHNNSGRSSHNNKHNKNESTSRTSSNNNTSYEEDNQDLDFCQRFFGDPLFSNFNVSFLFLFATLIPMLVWIPHFLSEYKRLKHIQQLESERQYRLKQARGEILSNNDMKDLLRNSGINKNEAEKIASGNGGGTSPTPRLIINGEDYSSLIKDNNKEDITILSNDHDSTKLQNTKSTLSQFPDIHPLNSHVGGGGGSQSIGSFNKAAQATVLPTLCSDGFTVGYDNWFLLRDAITEANSIAVEEFVHWSEYLAREGKNGKNSAEAPPVYHPPEPFVICPGAILNQKSPYRSLLSPFSWAHYTWSNIMYIIEYTGLLPSSSSTPKYNIPPRKRSHKNKKLSSILINAEDIVIECDMCTVDLPGTHFSFGPHAKNVLIKGITFRGATTSSLTFHHHGSDVSFEDCYWLYNSGGLVPNRNAYANVNGNDGMMSTTGGSTTSAGAVADLNSTSSVRFFRCVIDDVKQNQKRTTTGAGVANVPGMNPPAGHNVNNNNNQGAVSSSLTIRN